MISYWSVAVVLAMLMAAGIVSLAASGCAKTDPGQRDRVIENAPDPVGEARSVLQAYAAGGPMGSEASMFDDLTARVKAGAMVKALAPIVGGGGGGRPDFAEAGGKHPEKIDEMLAAAPAALQMLLG